jgi:Ca2+-dependent lipid-binding protein
VHASSTAIGADNDSAFATGFFFYGGSCDLFVVVITKSLMPPKRPVNAYTLFFTETVKQHPITSRQEAIERTSEAARLWNAMTEEQKEVRATHTFNCPNRPLTTSGCKPYVRKYKALREQYVVDRTKYFENTDPKIIRAINKRRVSRGKNRVRRIVPREQRKPMTSFFR